MKRVGIDQKQIREITQGAWVLSICLLASRLTTQEAAGQLKPVLSPIAGDLYRVLLVILTAIAAYLLLKKQPLSVLAPCLTVTVVLFMIQFNLIGLVVFAALSGAAYALTTSRGTAS